MPAAACRMCLPHPPAATRSFPFCGLQGTLPPELARLGSLKVRCAALYNAVGCCQLMLLCCGSAAYCCCQVAGPHCPPRLLQVLNLQHNQLSGGIPKTWTAIGALPALETLQLGTLVGAGGS